jgi:hypothetical protein
MLTTTDCTITSQHGTRAKSASQSFISDDPIRIGFGARLLPSPNGVLPKVLSMQAL